MEWYFAVLRNYAQFSGRARRMEFWMFVLINFAIGIVLGFIESLLGIPSVLSGLYGLAVLIPGIAVTIRRLHDTGRSGILWLIGLIPIVGWIILIIFMAEDSKPGDNQYGPNPKEHMPSGQ